MEQSVAIPVERHTGIAFETYVAKFYFNKINSCQQENKDFTLTLPEVRRLLAVKRCQYTGMSLTHQYVGSGITRFTDVTLDRIDNRKGYVQGNVKAVAHGINHLKSTFENPAHVNSRVDYKSLHKFSSKMIELLGNTKK